MFLVSGIGQSLEAELTCHTTTWLKISDLSHKTQLTSEKIMSAMIFWGTVGEGGSGRKLSIQSTIY